MESAVDRSANAKSTRLGEHVWIAGGLAVGLSIPPVAILLLRDLSFDVPTAANLSPWMIWGAVALGFVAATVIFARFRSAIRRAAQFERTVQQVEAGQAKSTANQRDLRAQLNQRHKLEAVGQLAAGIAHELNTPIQYVGDNTRFLQEAFDDLSQAIVKFEALLNDARDGSSLESTAREIARTLQQIDIDYLAKEIPRAVEQSLEGVDRVAKIVRSMKEFAHPDVGEKSSIDLNRAIESTVTVSRNEWRYVADLETDFDPGLSAVECHVGEMNQVFLNMIVNAAHAISDVVGDGSDGKGKIRITTRRDGDWAEIRISDTGCGIPEEVREKIFDPFFTTKEVGRGTGQGLGIAHNVVVEKHGGSIDFETEVCKGTTFIIRIPYKAPTGERVLEHEYA